MMPSATDNQVNGEVVVVQIQPPAEANRVTFRFFIAFFYRCTAHIHNLLKPLAHLLAQPDGAVIVLPPPINFVITSLYVFAEIKAQGSKFPFQTHPLAINVAVTSLLFYGLTSAAEHFFSATPLGPTSVYVIIPRFGRMGCLCILVASLLSLFYL